MKSKCETVMGSKCLSSYSQLRGVFLGGLLCCSLLSSPTASAQKQTLKLTSKTITLSKLFQEVEKQTGLLVVYRDVDLDAQSSINFSQASGNLSAFLDQFVKDRNIQYEITPNKYIVFTKQNDKRNTPVGKLTGKVSDVKGEPLVGATIVQKGTQNKTITDIDGNFTLEAPIGSTLVVSYIGCIDKEVKATKNMELTLSDDVAALDEVVVVGYGTVKKADLAGSVSVLDNKSFKDQPILQVSDALQGRISGVHVSNSGMPGGQVKIRVRGAGSVNRSNDPLYVVDGIVRESGLLGIDPDDVQSIQVLKDASATAIYGSRGSNGVVMVTTKSGKADVKRIAFDAQVGVSNVAHRFDLLNAEEFANAYNEAHPGTFSAQDLEDFRNGIKGTDWQDEMFKTGLTQNYKVTLTNGNKDTQYYISANYMGQTGAVIETKNERFQGRVNLATNISEWLNVTADISASHNVSKRHNFSASRTNAVWRTMNYSPVTEIVDPITGIYFRDNYSAITTDNPVGVMKLNAGQSRSDVFNGRIDLKFNILPGLTFVSSNGVDFNENKYYSFQSRKVSTESSMSNYGAQRMTVQSTNNLTFNKSWGVHALTATGVFEATQSKYRNLGISGTNLLTESVKWWNVGLAESRSDNNSYEAWTLLSWVGRLMYNYDNRYLVTGTFRADGSSKFFNQKWGVFPSLALAWSLGNEKFMQNQNVIQDAKVRLSYGLVGSQAISPYETLGLMAQTSYAYGGTSSYTGFWTGTNVPTKDLTWEKNHQFNVGVDFAVLNRKLRFSIDYFKKLTRDGLLKKSMPNYDGGGSYWVNASEVTNQGVDFSIDATIIDKKDFSWNSTFTGTYLKNEVTSLDNIPFITGYSPAAGVVEYVNRVVVGKPIGSFYLYEWTGLDATGHDTYADLDNSGTISEGDRRIIGKASPDFTLGWNNRLQWKNWELNMFFTGAFGAKRLNLLRYCAGSMNGVSRFITLKEAYENSYGKVENPQFPAVTVTNNSYLAASTKWLENADYIRLDNITLSYNLPKSVTKFADMQLSLSCQNLFTITGYKGMDPAGLSFMDSSVGSVDINDGIDMGAYPLTRTFTLGVKLNF